MNVYDGMTWKREVRNRGGRRKRRKERKGGERGIRARGRSERERRVRAGEMVKKEELEEETVYFTSTSCNEGAADPATSY